MVANGLKKLKSRDISCTILLVTGLLVSAMFAAQVAAITPSPAMIEQLKMLPKAEQQRLMKQYGLSPAMLNKTSEQQKIEQPTQPQPRNSDDIRQLERDIEPELKAFEQKELKPFGYDLFANEPISYSPVNDVPVPTEYMMGPGDQVNIQLYGKEPSAIAKEPSAIGKEPSLPLLLAAVKTINPSPAQLNLTQSLQTTLAATELSKNNLNITSQTGPKEQTTKTDLNELVSSEQKTSSVPLSLQKLTALLSSFSMQAPGGLKKQTDGDLQNHLSTNLKAQSTDETSEVNNTSTVRQSAKEELTAINKLQNLTNQLQKSLPGMQQLTSPAQLANLIEQFTRFQPLMPASINLSSLGPLAGALQLILGSKASLSSNKLSPQLTKQLQKIIKPATTGRNSSGSSGLIQALQLLGNLTAHKPLEEMLTSLSGHIQLYQHQSQEQSQNTQQQLLFFTLPTSDPTLPQVEGQIEQQTDNDDPANKSWQLTILLPIGDKAKLQAVATLQGKNVSIEMLSNNSDIVAKTRFYIDFLSERLKSLGLTTSQLSCKQGELPQSLIKRPNQLVELIV